MKKIILHPVIILIFVINIFFRLVYVFYGYVLSEEGFLIYGQKLAYSGLLPFVHYNAWNSILNNYIIGFYQFFIHPTIITQRVCALIISSIVFFLALYIIQNLKKQDSIVTTAFLLTFGSFTYLYYSSIPFSEQTMTLALMISFALLSKALHSKKKTTVLYTLALIAALLALPIRPQALPALIVIWLYIAYELKNNIRRLVFITEVGMLVLTIVYLPFILKGWDNFVYSIIWPLKAEKILVYQYGAKFFDIHSLVRFIIEIFKSYSLMLITFGAICIYKLYYTYHNPNTTSSDSRERFVFFSTIAAFSLAGTSLLHKPPYATYIYPAIPLLAYVAGFYIGEIFDNATKKTKVFCGSLAVFLALNGTALFPHSDYMKTSLASITQTPYSLLHNVHEYIESKTAAGSEILSFYVPAVAELDRVIPKDINEGEVSISILSDIESQKYHLTNSSMLKKYIASGKAEAIIITNFTRNSFGITEQERKEVTNILETYYYLDKTFDNFSSIGNPRVKFLYIYLRKLKT